MGKLAGLLAGLLFSTVTSGVAAQSSSPFPEAAGQRVDLPDVGLAITLPEGWRVNVAGSRADFVSFGHLWAPFESCSLLQVDPIPSHDSDAIPVIHGEEVLVSTDVDLPAGVAVRTDSLSDVDIDKHHTVYTIATDGPVVELSCRAVAPPDDRWLHLAETIEFRIVPGDQPAIGSAIVVGGFDGRVELPHLGFGLTFPSEWAVQGALAGEDLASGEPGGLWAQAPNERGAALAVCRVHGESCRPGDERRTTIEDMTEQLLACVEESPAFVVVEWAFLDLPAGRSAQAMMRNLADASLWVTYRFTDGDSQGVLTCGADPLPDDRWLSIAETIEFLPAED